MSKRITIAFSKKTFDRYAFFGVKVEGRVFIGKSRGDDGLELACKTGTAYNCKCDYLLTPGPVNEIDMHEECPYCGKCRESVKFNSITDAQYIVLRKLKDWKNEIVIEIHEDGRITGEIKEITDVKNPG